MAATSVEAQQASISVVISQDTKQVFEPVLASTKTDSKTTFESTIRNVVTKLLRGLETAKQRIPPFLSYRQGFSLVGPFGADSLIFLQLREEATTVSRFFTDKAGADAAAAIAADPPRPVSAPGDSSNPPAPATRRSFLLQRLRISGSRKDSKSRAPDAPQPSHPSGLPYPPNLIRSSRSEDLTRASTSYLNARAPATIDQLSSMMAQSLALNKPPYTASKRPRSTESRGPDNRPASPVASNAHCDSAGGGDNQRSRCTMRIPSYLNKTKNEISSAFHDLEWQQRLRLSKATSDLYSPYHVDRSAVVISRNRYGNVQPWDQSRIKLKIPLGVSDYVNASPIRLKTQLSSRPKAKDTNHANGAVANLADVSNVTPKEHRYIATQGPKEETSLHFWHMVMQETVGHVGVVVMLTETFEGNREKCWQYFPRDLNRPTLLLQEHHSGVTEKTGIEAGQLTASALVPDDGDDPFTDSDSGSKAGTDYDSDTEDKTKQQESKAEGEDVAGQRQKSNVVPPHEQDSVTLLNFTYDAETASDVRRLQLKIGSETKEIYHYLFANWPDFGTPERETRQAIVKLASASRQRAGDWRNPRIVHCSAGVGRTGTFIAIDHMLHALDTGQLVTEPQQMYSNEKAVGANSLVATIAPDTEKKPVQTWGKSGPVKESTPEPTAESHQGDTVGASDLIYDTVNTLRDQRMMMVMNELQLAFVYEVVRERFLAKYQALGMGVTVHSAGGGERQSSLKPPSAKAARVVSEKAGDERIVDLDMLAGTAVGRIKGEEDTVSEAETEIMDTDAEDPYQAVAPKSVRQDVWKGDIGAEGCG